MHTNFSQCTNCRNQGEEIIEEEDDKMAILEEQEGLEEDDDFAQFVFNAQN